MKLEQYGPIYDERYPDTDESFVFMVDGVEIDYACFKLLKREMTDDDEFVNHGSRLKLETLKEIVSGKPMEDKTGIHPRFGGKNGNIMTKEGIWSKIKDKIAGRKSTAGKSETQEAK